MSAALLGFRSPVSGLVLPRLVAIIEKVHGPLQRLSLLKHLGREIYIDCAIRLRATLDNVIPSDGVERRLQQGSVGEVPPAPALTKIGSRTEVARAVKLSRPGYKFMEAANRCLELDCQVDVAPASSTLVTQVGGNDGEFVNIGVTKIDVGPCLKAIGVSEISDVVLDAKGAAVLRGWLGRWLTARKEWLS